MQLRMADGNTWEAWEQALAAYSRETIRWSQDQLGVYQDLVPAAICLFDKTIELLFTISRESSLNSNTNQCWAVYLQFQHTYGRLLVASRLLQEGYLVDAAGLLRLAWESQIRGAYFALNPEAADRFISGSDISFNEARQALGKIAQTEGYGLMESMLKRDWSNLSVFSHSYSIHSLHLQGERTETLDGRPELTFGAKGVRRKPEFLGFTYALASIYTIAINTALLFCQKYLAEIPFLQEWDDFRQSEADFWQWLDSNTVNH